MAGIEELFGEAIYSYSRAQAIADGVLVDITEPGKEAGFKFPIAISRAAWDKYAEWDEEDNAHHASYQDQSGRLYDILWMLHVATVQGVNKVSERVGEAGGQVIEYKLFCVNRADRTSVEPEEITLKAVCGPSDDMSPCITIMLPEED